MDPFEALADPVRREILLLVRARPRTAGWLADRFPISRPAVSRHLRVLRESGLIAGELVGRERHYVLEPAAVQTISAFLIRLSAPLGGVGEALDALATEVHRSRRDRTTATTTAPREQKEHSA